MKMDMKVVIKMLINITKETQNKLIDLRNNGNFIDFDRVINKLIEENEWYKCNQDLNFTKYKNHNNLDRDDFTKVKCKVCGEDCYIANNIFEEEETHYCSWECRENDW